MSTTYPIRKQTALKQFKTYYLQQNNLRNYTLIVLGLNTALRISDLLTLRWQDVYFHREHRFREHICLTEQKTGKSTMIAINDSILEALQQYFDNNLPEEVLFPNNRGDNTPLSRYQAYRIVKRAASYAGMDSHISCHSMRKTFGYYAWKQGVPPAMLMNIYNHSSFEITKRYLGIEQEDKDDVFLSIKI